MALLKEIVTIEKGRKYNLLDEFQQGAIRVFQANDFRNEEKTLYTIDESGVWTNSDDILLVWDGSVGQMGFGKTGYIGSTMVKLTVKNKDKFYPAFIYRLLQTKSEFLKRKSTGATIMHINRKSLENIIVPNLSLKQQIEIAEKLTQAETLIAQRKQSIALLDEYVKSSFLEMFGDPVRNEKGFPNVRFGDYVLKIISGSSYGGEQKDTLRDDEFGVLKVSAVTWGTFNPKEFKVVNEKDLKGEIITLKKGDLLFSRANTKELVGATCIVNADYPRLFLPDKIWSLVLNEYQLNNWFVHYLFQNKSFRNILTREASGTSGSMLNISMEKLRNVKFAIPPISLQNQFAQIVEKTEALKAQYKASLQELQNMYGALSQQAFKGELVMPKMYAIDEPMLSVAAKPTPTYNKASKNELSDDELLQLYFMVINIAKHKGKKEEAYLAEVKMEKCCHLAEYNISQLTFNRNPLKEKHGPVDFERLNKLLAFAEAKDIFHYSKLASYEKYTEGGNFNRYFSNAMIAFRPFINNVNKFLDLTLSLDTDTIDLYATTFAAWNNLMILKKPTSFKNIAKEARWHELKNRFTDEKIKGAIEFLKEKTLLPKGAGLLVKEKSNP